MVYTYSKKILLTLKKYDNLKIKKIKNNHINI